MDYKNFIFFGVGAAVGSAVTAFLMKKKFDKTIEEEVEKFFEDSTVKDEEEDDNILITPATTGEFYEEKEVGERIKYNEIKKQEIFENVFKTNPSTPISEEEEAAELAKKNWTRTATGKPIPAPEVITPEEFFDQELDDDGEEIVKAEDPLIYFEEDGVLINTEDDIPEPFNKDFRDEYFIIDETVKHFGEYGDEDVLYLRCFEKPVTDYKIVRVHSTFKDSPWYPATTEGR